MTNTSATVQFLGDWRQAQSGAIERGGRLKVEYDMRQLPHCFTQRRGAEFGDITAYVRFHPRGEIVSGSVVAPLHDRENPPWMVIGHKPTPFETAVPDDATRAEIWFHNFSEISGRCDAWDSRFGDNYWFEAGGAPPRIPTRPVSYRGGALTRPEMVNVLEQSATKVNVFPRPAGGGSSQGKDLQTLLKMTAWVAETAYGANAWIDAHVFDGNDTLNHAETITLTYTGFGPVFRYEFSGKIYQGATATPGSVQPRPEARKVQYRLYYEANYRVYTDGILHQQELQEDAVTI